MARTLPIAALLFADVAWAAGGSATLYTFSKNNQVYLGPELQVAIPVMPNTEIEAMVALSSIQPEGADHQFHFMNPLITAHYEIALGVGKLRLGGGFALPFAQQGADASGINVQAANTGARGGWNAFMFRTDTLTFVLPAKFELQVPLIDLSAEVGFFTAIGTGEGQKFKPGVQMAVEAAFPLLVILDVGLRTQLIFFEHPGVIGTGLTNSAGDFSLEPFTQLKLGPFRARAGFVLNMKDPYGFSFDTGKFWAFRLGVGLEF